MYISRGTNGTGIVEVPAGGTLRLGTVADPVYSMNIAYSSGTGPNVGSLDFSVTDPYFEAYINGGLGIAHNYYTGSTDGELILGGNSQLHVGSPTTLAGLSVGYNHGYSGMATGLLDASRGQANLHLSEFDVGYNAGSAGHATGTFTTGNGSVVTATNAYVSRGTSATGTVNLRGGLFSANTINMGAGGTFNFTGGRLAVNRFNTYGGTETLLQQGGTLAPGFSLSDRLKTSLPGLSIINGDYEMDGGLLEIELFGKTAGSGHDQLLVNGSVDLDGGALDLLLCFEPTLGDQFVIVNNDGADPVSGTFLGLAEGATLTETYLANTYNFTISYLGYTGNDVVLRAGNVLPADRVPAPGALALVSIGAGLIGWLRRRRIV